MLTLGVHLALAGHRRDEEKEGGDRVSEKEHERSGENRSDRGKTLSSHFICPIIIALINSFSLTHAVFDHK